MTLVQILLVLAVVAGVAVVAAGLVGGGLSAPTRTLPWTGLGDGDVGPRDVEAVRFAVGLRGYRMEQVDEVLDRLAAEIARRDDEIAWRDAEIARLRDPGAERVDDLHAERVDAPAGERVDAVAERLDPTDTRDGT